MESREKPLPAPAQRMVRPLVMFLASLMDRACAAGAICRRRESTEGDRQRLRRKSEATKPQAGRTLAGVDESIRVVGRHDEHFSRPIRVCLRIGSLTEEQCAGDRPRQEGR